MLIYNTLKVVVLGMDIQLEMCINSLVLGIWK